MSSEPELAPRGRIGGVVVVWIAAVVIGVAIGVVTPVGQRAAWVTIGLAGCLVLSFAVQLWLGRAHRFISRVAVSMLGSLVILGVISAGFGVASLAA